MSCENIPSIADLEKTKLHIDDFGRLMGTGTGTSTNVVTGQVRPTYNAVMSNLGYVRIGTFSEGGTITDGRQTLLWDISDGGDGQEYGWSGSFPLTGKIVPPGSTPLTTGGIAVGAWISRFDPELRIQSRENTRRSYSDSGYTLVAGSFESGGTLASASDVLLHEASGIAYSGAGPFPQIVPAGTNPASVGFTSRAGATSLNKSDIARFGYVYGSGADGKTSVLAAISATGVAHISGPTTLSRFDWPQGAKITGNATITYSRLPAVPCILDSTVSVDNSKLRAVYAHQVYDICDMLQLKTAGFNTVIHYGAFGGTSGDMAKACNAAEAVGIKLILGGPLYGQTDTPAQDLNSRDSVIGYYLFDEPQNAGITAAAQQTRINAFRAFTSKKLVMADHNIFSFETSTIPTGVFEPGYDIIFIDKYRHDGQTAEFVKQDAIMAWAELSYKALNCAILPAIGTFSTDLNGGSDNFKDKAKQIAFGKQFFKMGDGGYAAFSWESNLIVNTHRTITTDTDFYAMAKEFNGVIHSEPYEMRSVVFNKTTLPELLRIRESEYSSVDVTPFAVVNAGSNIDERRSTFADAGLGVRNLGGLFATNLKTTGCVVVQFYFQNYVDATNVNYAIATSNDDFYTSTDQLTKAMSNSVSGWYGYVGTTKDKAIGIRATPVSSNANRWKFLRGGFVVCSWTGTNF